MSLLSATWGRVDRIRRRPLVRRTACLVAVGVFVAGLFASIRARPSLALEIAPAYLVAAFVLYAPAVVMLNASATRASASAAGARLSLFQATRLFVLASAANQLPLPGGAALRVTAFCDAGARLASAARSTLVYGLAWFSASALVAAAGAVALRLPSLAGLFALAAAGTFVGGWIASGEGRRAGVAILRPVVYGFLASVLYVGGLWLTVAALGGEAPVAALCVVGAAGVIGAAATIAPGGLGVREVSAAGIAAAVGVDPALAFAATALLYLVSASSLGVIAAIVAAMPASDVEGPQPSTRAA